MEGEIAFEFLLEKLPSAKQLNLFLKSNPDDIDVKVSTSKVVISSKPSQDGSVSWTREIPLDCEIFIPKTTIDRRKSCSLVNMHIERDSFQDETDDFPTASELDVKSISSFYCRFCGAELTKGKRFQRILPLPSEYWQEVSDLWMCCDNQKLTFSRDEPISSRPGWALVGRSHVQLHRDDVEWSALQWGDRSMKTIGSENAVFVLELFGPLFEFASVNQFLMVDGSVEGFVFRAQLLYKSALLFE
eukprot:138193_1